jgi:hypothetical protein
MAEALLKDWQVANPMVVANRSNPSDFLSNLGIVIHLNKQRALGLYSAKVMALFYH